MFTQLLPVATNCKGTFVRASVEDPNEGGARREAG